MINRHLALGLALLIFVTGCPSHFPEVANATQAPSMSYHVPPKELIAIVKDVVSSPPLSIGVQEEKDGSILTGWQSFPGDWHVARRWQERTQYRITVIPDFNDPTHSGRISVQQYTDTRASEGMKWNADPDVQRAGRADDMLKTLDQAIRSRVKT